MSSEETRLAVDGGGRIPVAEEADPAGSPGRSKGRAEGGGRICSTGRGRRRAVGGAFVTDVSVPAYNTRLVYLEVSAQTTHPEYATSDNAAANLFVSAQRCVSWYEAKSRQHVWCGTYIAAPHGRWKAASDMTQWV